VREQLQEMDGLDVLALIDSPIAGGDGNREFLLHAKRLS
jgi:23S rRNA (cytidine1920-2'-O)/16S rRNA (cytidine1409-2'-O)-methyltransferase